jgi:uncharacterized protein (TIGR02246 family)
MNAPSNDSPQVLDLVRRWAAAELAGDVNAYGDLLTADFTGVGPVGFVLSGAQWAQRHLGDLHNEKFEVLDPHVRIYGDPGDTAVVEAVQRQATTAMGRDTSGSFRLGLVAVRAAQGWRIAHIQLSGPLIKPGEMPAFAR